MCTICNTVYDHVIFKRTLKSSCHDLHLTDGMKGVQIDLGLFASWAMSDVASWPVVRVVARPEHIV